MSRGRWRRLILVAVVILLPFTCIMFMIGTCSPPGTLAPAPWLQLPGDSMAFSPDSKWLAIRNKGDVDICDLTGEPRPRTLPTRANSSWSAGMAFSYDSKQLLIGSGKRLLVIAVPGGELLQSIEWTSDVHDVFASPTDDAVCVVMPHERPDVTGATLVGTAIEAFRLRDPSSRTRLIAHGVGSGQGVRNVQFSRDGRLAMACDYDTYVLKVWTTNDWVMRHEIPAPLVSSFGFDPTGAIIAIADLHDHCRIWSLTENRQIRRFSTIETAVDLRFEPSGGLVVLRNHFVYMKCLGTTVTGYSQSGKRKWTWRAFDDGAKRLAVSPDRRFLAVEGASEVKVWRWDQLAPGN